MISCAPLSTRGTSNNEDQDDEEKKEDEKVKENKDDDDGGGINSHNPCGQPEFVFKETV